MARHTRGHAQETGKSAAEVVLTVLHAEAVRALGLQGVGRPPWSGRLVVNALSEWLDLEIRRGGRV